MENDRLTCKLYTFDFIILHLNQNKVIDHNLHHYYNCALWFLENSIKVETCGLRSKLCKKNIFMLKRLWLFRIIVEHMPLLNVALYAFAYNVFKELLQKYEVIEFVLT